MQEEARQQGASPFKGGAPPPPPGKPFGARGPPRPPPRGPPRGPRGVPMEQLGAYMPQAQVSQTPVHRNLWREFVLIMCRLTA